MMNFKIPLLSLGKLGRREVSPEVAHSAIKPSTDMAASSSRLSQDDDNVQRSAESPKVEEVPADASVFACL